MPRLATLLLATPLLATGLSVAACGRATLVSSGTETSGGTGGSGSGGSQSSGGGAVQAGGSAAGGFGGEAPSPCDSPAWLKRVGGESQQEVTEISTVVGSSTCRFQIAGRYGFEFELDGFALPLADGLDTFVASLDGDGAVVNVHAIKSSGDPTVPGYALASHADGSYAVVDTGSESVTIAGVAYTGGGGGDNAIVTVFNADHTVRWVRLLGDDAHQFARAVTFDDEGSVYVAGGFNGAIVTTAGTLFSSTQYNSFVIKFSATGVAQWIWQFPEPTAASVAEMAWSDDGSLVIAGAFAGVLQTTDGPIVADGTDAFVITLDSSLGVPTGRRIIGGPGTTFVHSIDITRDVVFVAGEFSGSINLGGTMTATFDDAADAFVVGYNAADLTTSFWATYGGPASDRAFAIAGAQSAGFFVGGSFAESMFLPNITPTTNAQRDGFILTVGPDGLPLPSTLNATQAADVYALSVDHRGALYAGGAFRGGINNSVGALSTAGDQDGFIGKFAP